jgi:hypothetical protein
MKTIVITNRTHIEAIQRSQNLDRLLLVQTLDSQRSLVFRVLGLDLAETPLIYLRYVYLYFVLLAT